MFRCLLCDKKFKTERGLSIHLCRTHNIHGHKGRVSFKTIHEFFPLVRKRHWAKAERSLKLTMNKIGEDEWIKGYIHALRGMITALKTSNSPPQPYVVKIEGFGSKKLQEVKDMFNELSNTIDDENTFDAGYFQAWEDFTYYVLHIQD